MTRSASAIGKSNVQRSKSHERLIAKWLTEWAGTEFRRRRVTGRDTATRMVELCADVIAIADDFNYSVEAKCGKGFSFDAILADPVKSIFGQWWFQACYDAQLISTDLKRTIYPMIFFRPLLNQNWIGISANSTPTLKAKVPHSRKQTACFVNHILCDIYAHIGPVTGNISHSRTNKSMVTIQLDPVILMRWKDFADAVDPNSAFHKV